MADLNNLGRSTLISVIFINIAGESGSAGGKWAGGRGIACCGAQVAVSKPDWFKTVKLTFGPAQLANLERRAANRRENGASHAAARAFYRAAVEQLATGGGGGPLTSVDASAASVDGDVDSNGAAVGAEAAEQVSSLCRALDSWAQMEFKLKCATALTVQQPSHCCRNCNLLARQIQAHPPEPLTGTPLHISPFRTLKQAPGAPELGEGAPECVIQTRRMPSIHRFAWLARRHHTAGRRLFQRSIKAARSQAARGLHTHLTWARCEMQLDNQALVRPQ